MSRKTLLISVVALATAAALLVAGPVAAGPDGRPDGATPGEVAAVPDDGSAKDEPPNDFDGPTPRDIVHNNDVIVDGSACVGFDCVDGESFSFATLIIKENNLRIFANDTSNSASFPRRDWQLEFNSTSNGGGRYFMVRDCGDGASPGSTCGGTNVFTVEAGAGSNALYVESTGDVGFGTSNPVVETHAKAGDTPTHRLEQDGTSGWTPQTWDLAGNESNFFIRDVTNGSKLPFRIRPGAATNSIIIDTDGDVGMGTASPEAALEVTRTNGEAAILVEENSSTVTARTLLQLENEGAPRIIMEDSDAGDAWRLGLISGGVPKFEIGVEGGSSSRFRYFQDGRFDIRNDDNTITLALDAVGNLTITGVYTPSDRDSKTNFHAVDAREMLEKVIQLDIETWAYKTEHRVRHVGPMAQDWYALFGLASTETVISQTDLNGVTLASIQALAAENQELGAENQELRDRVDRLEAQMEQLLAASAGN